MMNVYLLLFLIQTAVGSFTVGGIRAQEGDFNETEGMSVSGLYYLGRVCVNGTLQSIRAVGPINNSTLSGGEIVTPARRFALLVIRNSKVYEVFRVRRNLATENALRGNDINPRNIDVKESDDILVFIFNTCELNEMGTTFLCPWQVSFPAVNSTTSYYDSSDNIMTRNSSVFDMEINNHIMMNSTTSTNIYLNVEVTITENSATVTSTATKDATKEMNATNVVSIVVPLVFVLVIVVAILIIIVLLCNLKKRPVQGEDIEPVYETVGPKPPPVQDIPQVQDTHFIMSSSGAYGVIPQPEVITQNELYGNKNNLGDLNDLVSSLD